MASKSKESGGLAHRYAYALFELADDAKALAAVGEDMQRISKAVDESADLRRLILSPVLSRDQQGRAAVAVVETLEVQDLTRKFVGLLARNRRLFALPQIIRAFQDFLAGRRGETAAEVTSAKKLTEAQLKSIGDALKSAVGTSVMIVERVDPSLLGGLVVRVGSRMVDSSLRTKLQRLRLAMKGVG